MNLGTKDSRRVKIRMRLLFRCTSFLLLCVGFLLYGAYMPSYTGFEISSGTFLDSNTVRRLEGECPAPAEPAPLVIGYIVGVLWLFVGLAIIADELFVPALDVIADKWELSPDVAGATLMAAGGSSPELFTSAMGTFLRSSVGFGAIVGSAVFNILFVVGMCALMTDKPMQLTWWPIMRDSCYYVVVLVVLAVFFGVNTPQMIDWYEALVLHIMYWIYVFIMYHNKALFAFFSRCLFKESIVADVDAAAAVEQPLFLSPSRFRTGIASLCSHNKPFADTAGVHLAIALNGKLEDVFAKYDKNRSGTLDASELAAVFGDLGLPASPVNIQTALKELDHNGDKAIDFEEFSLWYIRCRQRLMSEVKVAFNKIDTDGSGTISSTEIRNMLKHLGTKAVSDEDVTAALKEMRDSTDGGLADITFDEFEKWYSKSLYLEKSCKDAETVAEAAEGLSLLPPEGEDRTVRTMLWYICTLPFIVLFYLTVPDVRLPGRRKYVYLAFLACLAWMGVFSYFMVSWVETIGATLGIPSVIMGLTFLAAGTSVPDMLSAVIVAKQGQADQAVSSSIGSNVFDITVGLAFPWLLFWAVYQEAIFVDAGQLFISILVLVLCLFVVVLALRLRKWALPASSGVFFILLYIGYVGLQLGIAEWGSC